MNKPLSPAELANIDGYWRASNYLSVGQIYLLDNPLLREPLKREHIKPRLLGHWGTSPGLNLIYVHLSRVIAAHDLNVLFITGPGHGGPSLVAHAYLEGTYTEVYPNVTEDEAGMKKLFTQFSFPGGIPSHVAPETPGSIHEGGELGYALSHAFGAAFDNPDLIVAAVVGDGEAETGPLATSWHSNKFLNPVLPKIRLLGGRGGIEEDDGAVAKEHRHTRFAGVAQSQDERCAAVAIGGAEYRQIDARTGEHGLCLKLPQRLDWIWVRHDRSTVNVPSVYRVAAVLGFIGPSFIVDAGGSERQHGGLRWHRSIAPTLSFSDKSWPRIANFSAR